MRAHRLEKNVKSHLVESHFHSQKDTEDPIDTYLHGGGQGRYARGQAEVGGCPG